jgi:cell division initiation protein
MIESQLELVKKEEWDDILQPPASEQPEIETIKEVKKELDEKDGEETADLKNDSEPSVSVEEEYEEGMTPAVELP